MPSVSGASMPNANYVKYKGFNVNIYLNNPAALATFVEPMPHFFPGYTKEEAEEEQGQDTPIEPVEEPGNGGDNGGGEVTAEA